VLGAIVAMDINELPISPNPGQQNMDKISNMLNERVGESMGVLEDTGPAGRHFLEGEHSLFGYDGVVVTGGKIVSLVNLDGDEDVPTVSLGAEVTIEGNSRGYVSSGHKPGDQVKVIGFIEPFFSAGEGQMSSDKIIKVEGNGTIGWIKPSEIDKQLLKKQKDEEMQKLFDPTKK